MVVSMRYHVGNWSHKIEKREALNDLGCTVNRYGRIYRIWGHVQNYRPLLNIVDTAGTMPEWHCAHFKLTYQSAGVAEKR